MTPRIRILPFFMICYALVACGESNGQSARSQIQTPDTDIIILDWSDLMPEGEEEVLDQLYESFYIDLENRMMGGQMPLSEYDVTPSYIEEGSEFDKMPQLGTHRTVSALNGQRVRLPGFIVPLDYEFKGRLKNFLFVPYFGACIHTPPPPPNQIVFVEGEVDVSSDEIWLPYWVEGVLHTRSVENDLGDAAYTLTFQRIEPYKD